MRLIFIFTIGLATTLLAKPVTLPEAQNVARNWMFERLGKQLTIDTSFQKAQPKTDDLYRIIRLSPSGWVIVSSDDVVKPIIGYGESNIDSSSQPPAFEQWMKNRADEIEKAKSTTSKKIDTQAQKVISAQWKRLKQNFKKDETINSKASTYEYVVRPLFWMGSNEDNESQGIRWNQGTYYNSSCPADANGPNGHVWAGCVAVSMGQLMRYYQYPAYGIGSYSYTNPTYGEQSVDFASTNYDWANMPLTLISENSLVATALYHAGVAVNMGYSVNVSNALIFTNNAMSKFFGYEVALVTYRSYYTDAKWHSILKNELDAGHPLYYQGFAGSSGHAFNIDGYDSDDFYHLNWGWGGSCNGKYTLDDLRPDSRNFSGDQSTMILRVNDDSPVVLINDEQLESCVMESLDVESASEITELKVKYLEQLKCKNKEFLDISELENLTNLRSLYLSNNNISDITALQNLTSLRTLDLSNNNISDITLLHSLTSLQNLYISNNNISDITSLQNLTSLRGLIISNNNISDITPLQNLTTLDYLNLSNNNISDITALQNLTSLRTLDLLNNNISDITALQNLTSLRTLDLSNNNISDITPLQNLTSLQKLDLENNNISDITPLQNLTTVKYLYLSNNNISDITVLQNLTTLDYLYLENNNISDITPLQNLTTIGTLYLSDNSISDIKPLQSLTSLKYLYLKNNNISDITPLENLITLQSLNLENNNILRITALQNLNNLRYLKLAQNYITDFTPINNLDAIVSGQYDQREPPYVDITPIIMYLLN